MKAYSATLPYTGPVLVYELSTRLARRRAWQHFRREGYRPGLPDVTARRADAYDCDRTLPGVVA